MEKKLEVALADYMERYQEPFMFDDIDYLLTMVCWRVKYTFATIFVNCVMHFRASSLHTLVEYPFAYT